MIKIVPGRKGEYFYLFFWKNRRFVIGKFNTPYVFGNPTWLKTNSFLSFLLLPLGSTLTATWVIVEFCLVFVFLVLISALWGVKIQSFFGVSLFAVLFKNMLANNFFLFIRSKVTIAKLEKFGIQKSFDNFKEFRAIYVYYVNNKKYRTLAVSSNSPPAEIEIRYDFEYPQHSIENSFMILVGIPLFVLIALLLLLFL